MSSSKRGFTLVELLVVVGMIAVILGALSTSITASQNRARIQRAKNDVNVTAQAILAYENFNSNNKLPTLTQAEADSGTLGFLLGNGESSSTGSQIPALLMASLQSGGKMRDPWGTPYRVTIKEGSSSIKFSTASSSMQTRYFFPNFYRLGKGERDL